MRHEAMAFGEKICQDLLSSFCRLDLFEETLSNRLVKSFQATVLTIIHHDGSEAAQEHRMLYGDGNER